MHEACALDVNLVGVYRQRQDYQHSQAWGPRWHKSEARVIHAVSDDHQFWDVNLVKCEELQEAIGGMLGK